jgi:hypothetical protein
MGHERQLLPEKIEIVEFIPRQHWPDGVTHLDQGQRKGEDGTDGTFTTLRV